MLSALRTSAHSPASINEDDIQLPPEPIGNCSKRLQVDSVYFINWLLHYFWYFWFLFNGQFFTRLYDERDDLSEKPGIVRKFNNRWGNVNKLATSRWNVQEKNLVRKTIVNFMFWGGSTKLNTQNVCLVAYYSSLNTAFYCSSSEWLGKAGMTSSHLVVGHNEERPNIPQPQCGRWHRAGTGQTTLEVIDSKQSYTLNWCKPNNDDGKTTLIYPSQPPGRQIPISF